MNRPTAQVFDSVCPLPKEQAVRLLPYSALKLMYGADVIKQYAGRDDLVVLFFNNAEEVLHVDDYELVSRVTTAVVKRLVIDRNMHTVLPTAPMMMELHRAASDLIAEYYADDQRKKAICLLSDQYGCGYWRMLLPATHIKSNGWVFDVTPAETLYEYLVTYNTVMLQRVCKWESFYVVQRLRRNGVRVVYDLDDNLWELPPFHPAYKKFGIDEKTAATAIIREVDAVTVTTKAMEDAIALHCGEDVRKKIVIIPNAIDVSQFPVRPVYPVSCQDKDKPFRILWAGSATHEQDFMVCMGALDQFMKAHQDDSVRVLFVGYLPAQVSRLVQEKHWFNRVEHVEFMNIETYFDMLRRVKADIAIAPLLPCAFNAAKSNIKWMEYTLAGIPVVASNFPPYSNTIVHNTNGLLASTKDEWVKALEAKFRAREDTKWYEMVSAARDTVESEYHIGKTADKWLSVISGAQNT